MRDMLRSEREALVSLRRFAFIVLANAQDVDAAVKAALTEARETCPYPDSLHKFRLCAMRALFRSCLKSHVSTVGHTTSHATGEGAAGRPEKPVSTLSTRLRGLPVYQRTAAALIIVERLSHDDASVVMDSNGDQVREYATAARKKLFPEMES